MPSLNKVMIIGNLTRNVELRHLPKGTAIADLGLAINSSVQSGDGQRRDEVTYADVTCWGRLAENAAQYLLKGSSVFVEGRLSMETWNDKQTGQKRMKLKIVAESLQFLSRSDRQESQRHQSPPQRQQQSQQGFDDDATW